MPSFKPVLGTFDHVRHETPVGAARCSSPCALPTTASADRAQGLVPTPDRDPDYVYCARRCPRCGIARAGGLLPPVRQRLVRDQSGDGRQFVPRLPRPGNRGLSRDAGRALIDELTEAAIQAENIYVHAWQPGDVVLTTAAGKQLPRRDLRQLATTRRPPPAFLHAPDPKRCWASAEPCPTLEEVVELGHRGGGPQRLVGRDRSGRDARPPTG